MSFLKGWEPHDRHTLKVYYHVVPLPLNLHNQGEERKQRKSQAEGPCSWTDHSAGCLCVDKRLTSRVSNPTIAILQCTNCTTVPGSTTIMKQGQPAVQRRLRRRGPRGVRKKWCPSNLRVPPFKRKSEVRCCRAEG